MLSLFSRDVLDKIWDLIESVFEGFPTYSFFDMLDINYVMHVHTSSQRG